MITFPTKTRTCPVWWLNHHKYQTFSLQNTQCVYYSPFMFPVNPWYNGTIIYIIVPYIYIYTQWVYIFHDIPHALEIPIPRSGPQAAFCTFCSPGRSQWRSLTATRAAMWCRFACYRDGLRVMIQRPLCGVNRLVRYELASSGKMY